MCAREILLAVATGVGMYVITSYFRRMQVSKEEIAAKYRRQMAEKEMCAAVQGEQFWEDMDRETKENEAKRGLELEKKLAHAEYDKNSSFFGAPKRQPVSRPKERVPTTPVKVVGMPGSILKSAMKKTGHNDGVVLFSFCFFFVRGVRSRS